MWPNQSSECVQPPSRCGVASGAAMCLSILASVMLSHSAAAQEIRYSWMDMSFTAQDVDRAGFLPSPGIPDQIIDVAVTEGSGVRFRGSLGTWKGFYLMVDYSSTDIDLTGSITNPTFTDDFADEFDFTMIRGGIGLKYSIFEATDIFGEITYDSLDFDFGSFAGEDFDMGGKGAGATLGVRTMFGHHFQMELRVRYSDVGDADLTGGFFEDDTPIGAGFAWEVIRGLSIVGDVEVGEFTNWSMGFRLDFDEN